jgi:hypothetical protein
VGLGPEGEGEAAHSGFCNASLIKNRLVLKASKRLCEGQNPEPLTVMLDRR